MAAAPQLLLLLRVAEVTAHFLQEQQRGEGAGLGEKGAMLQHTVPRACRNRGDAASTANKSENSKNFTRTQ